MNKVQTAFNCLDAWFGVVGKKANKKANKMINLYEKLGIQPTDDENQIKQAIEYAKRKQLLTPEQINKVVNILLNQEVKQRYDTQLFDTYPHLRPNDLQNSSHNLQDITQNLANKAEKIGKKLFLDKNLFDGQELNLCIPAEIKWKEAHYNIVSYTQHGGYSARIIKGFWIRSGRSYRVKQSIKHLIPNEYDGELMILDKYILFRTYDDEIIFLHHEKRNPYLRQFLLSGLVVSNNQLTYKVNFHISNTAEVRSALHEWEKRNKKIKILYTCPKKIYLYLSGIPVLNLLFLHRFISVGLLRYVLFLIGYAIFISISSLSLPSEASVMIFIIPYIDFLRAYFKAEDQSGHIDIF